MAAAIADGLPGQDRFGRAGASLRIAAATAVVLWPVSRCLAAFALKVLWAGLRLLYWMTRELVRLLWDYVAQTTQLTGPAQPTPPQLQTSEDAAEVPVAILAETAQQTLCQQTEKCATTHEVEDGSFEAFEALCQRTEESVTLGEAEDSSSEMPSSDAAERFNGGDGSSGLFTLWFTVRDAWDQPEDDEMIDASLENEWIDLGSSSATASDDDTVASNPAPAEEREDNDQAGEEEVEDGKETKDDGENERDDKGEPAQHQAAAATRRGPLPTGPELRSRLQQMLPTGADVDAFVDMHGPGIEGQASGGMVIRLEGPLRPESWEAACRLALGCEACGVYMSNCYDAMFRNLAPALVQPLETQVACALGHWCGRRAKCVAGAGLGIEGGAFAGLEGLAANVAAVLRGEPPPGWHRLEWTPHGAGAVSHMTY